jgi:hypothetical protein
LGLEISLNLLVNLKLYGYGAVRSSGEGTLNPRNSIDEFYYPARPVTSLST